MLTHIRTEYSSCKGKETSRLWNLGFFFHSQSESFDINLSLKLESVVWKTPPLFKDSAGAPDNAGICISLFYLWFHGVLCIFLLFFFVFENGNTLCPGECSSGTDWGCTVKSLLVLPFMVSQFRHAPSCLVLLFIKYDRSNMISWKKKKRIHRSASYLYSTSPDANENKNSLHGCAYSYMTDNCKCVLLYPNSLYEAVIF